MGAIRKFYLFMAERPQGGQVDTKWAMRYVMGWKRAKAAMALNAAIPTISSIRAFGPKDPKPAAYRVS